VKESPPAAPDRLPTEARRKALLQGLGAILLSVAFFVLLGYAPVPANDFWRRTGAGVVGLLGESFTVVGMWRLSVARDRRWDLLGIIVLPLMWASLLPCLIWMFLVVTAVTGGTLFGGK
jgi:hypothetical protein